MSMPPNVAPCNYQQRLILQTPQGRQTIKKPCPHLNAVNDVFCIFHSKDTKHKAPTFRREFQQLFLAEDGKKVIGSRFAGFVWPAIDFSDMLFPEDADFSDNVFTGTVTFKGASFQRGASFNGSLFEQDAFFNHTHFHGLTTFTETQFDGNATFDDAFFENISRFESTLFKKQALFFFSVWEQEAGFHQCRFGAEAGFNGSRFKHIANFSGSHFEGPALFRECHHKLGTTFAGARFRDSIHAEAGHFRYLRMQNLPEAGSPRWTVDLSNSVLDGAIFPAQQNLERINFRNSFLLGVSFSDCRLLDCDFTGAVLHGTHLRLSHCDDRTRHATRFIYTDYAIQAVNNDGKRGQVLIPRAATRVPVRGEFGKEAYYHFDFTHLFAGKYQWSLSLETPMAIRLTLIDYLNLFVETMQVCFGIQVDLQIYHEGRALRFDFTTDSDDHIATLRTTFAEYTEAGFEPREILFHNDRLTEMDRNLFRNRLNNRLSHLRHEALAAKKLLQSVFRELQDQGNVHKSKRFPQAYQTVKLFSESPGKVFNAPSHDPA
ncbi:pentapeptide repeat-containing protein [Acanthopleuribacter pedis]|uniref:Pentapeptide repeat-containing protein n=1 Tax=Acanthopleuribacter pedis TaxID=442870 RepID=A0A8J7U0Y1_9BACT|nr:pentapeptide repeat-containing protein [Acanthopleuribacter pedis]MBO1317568.1 pentapeptide repeat-containing protein [Acanthopleuribacter pedis]